MNLEIKNELNKPELTDFIGHLVTTHPLHTAAELQVFVKEAVKVKGYFFDSSPFSRAYRSGSIHISLKPTLSHMHKLVIIAHEYHHAVVWDRGYFQEGKCRKHGNAFKCEIHADIMSLYYVSAYTGMSLDELLQEELGLYQQTKEYMKATPQELWISNLPELKK